MTPFLKKVAGNTGLGLASGIVILLAGILRAVFLGRFLDLETFGYLVICVNLVTLLRFLLQIGLMDTVIRFFPDFESQKRHDALASLVMLVSYISLAITMVILVAALLFSSGIASSWYSRPDLATPILVSAILSGGFLMAQTATAILRVQNQFLLALIFPTIGACLIPAFIWLFQRSGMLNLTNAVLAIGLGEFIGYAGCVTMAFLKTKSLLRFSPAIMRLEPLRDSFGQIRSTLGQTSLFGILRSSSEVGGTFLLGLIGTPAQVAILGMATQLARPLGLVQSSLGSAIAPEITRLHAEEKNKMLYHFISRYVVTGIAILAMGLGIAHLLLPSVISLFLKPAYLDAIPVFLVIASSYGLVMAFQPFLPVAIARGEVGRRNLVVCSRLLYLAAASVAGLTAMGVAISLLAGNLTVRVINDFPLMKRLRASAATSR